MTERSTYLIVAGDFVRTGGMDAANRALALYLANSGATVHLVAHRIDPSVAQHPGIRWHRVPRPLGSHTLGAPLLERAARRVARALLPQRPRVILNGGNARLPASANWVHFVHAASEVPTAIHRRLQRSLQIAQERAALQLADLVIADSRRTADDVALHCGIARAKIRVVYYGGGSNQTGSHDATTAPNRGSGPKRALFVGALGDRRKGFDTLFRSWASLACDPAWDTQLLVVGTGRQLPVWRARVKKARLGDAIQFLGFRMDVPRLLSSTDLLIAPSRYEPFGLAVYEALCAGVPAIVSRRAGVAELYSKELHPLLLDDPDGVDELSRRVRDWRERSEEFKNATAELGQRLRLRTWDVMAREFVGFLERTRSSESGQASSGSPD